MRTRTAMREYALMFLGPLLIGQCTATSLTAASAVEKVEWRGETVSASEWTPRECVAYFDFALREADGGRALTIAH